jgi:hypothetical protein
MTKQLGDLELGDRFRLSGHTWIALDWGNVESAYAIEGYARVCLMADMLKKYAFDTDNSNDWRTSSAREYLNGEFLDKLTLNTKPLMYISDLTSDCGLKDYGTCEDLVFLLSASDYRRNRYAIPDANGWWWLATPHSTPRSVYPSLVCMVGADGTLASSNAYIANYSLRPAIYINQDTKVEVTTDD